jgi:6,7-dimethyl-8-ribityllumazine synthase
MAERSSTMARSRRQVRRKETGVRGARILVVEARYYEDIADMLLRGARRVLRDAGAAFDLVTVPGALEIPAAIMIGLHGAEAREQPYDGVVALGCVIRGETAHYDIVAGESARALMDIAIALDMPMGNGILTVDTDAQARARARTSGGDKGGGAARAALTLVRLKRQLLRRGRR